MSEDESSNKLIPPKPKKQEPEPDINLPETKVDVLNPKLDLSKDAWEIFNIDNLPTISDEQMQRYTKHVADRRDVWVKSQINKTSFPIRCRVIDGEYKEGQEPEFATDDEGNAKLIVKNFKYNPISIYQRERIVTMTAELTDIQRTAQALAIIKSVEKTEGKIAGMDIKIDFQALPDILKHEDFTTIQSKLMKKQIELNHYRMKAYLSMSNKDYACAYWGDTRDWLDVCVEKEQHVLDPQIGVM